MNAFDAARTPSFAAGEARIEATASRNSAGRFFVRTITLTGTGSLAMSIRGGSAIASRHCVKLMVRSDGNPILQYPSANFASGSVIERYALSPRAYAA